MNVSAPFIQRPIATSLLGVAVLFGGLLGYLWLPVSALPQVDFPTIQVTTQLPGASPDTMVSLVTAPLERQFGQIPSLSTMTSSSSYGISQVTLQFDLNRDIDAAAQDVQAAINAAASALPRNLPYPPIYSKVNPADTPIVTLALTSDTVSLRALSDLADTLLAQRLSRDFRRRQRRDAGRHQAGGAHPGRSAAARGLRAVARGHPPGDRERERRGAEGRVRRRVPVLHHRGERPARRRRSLPHAGDRLSQQQSRDAARRRRDRRRAGERQGLGLVQRPAGRDHRHPPPARRQRGADGQEHPGRAAAAAPHPAGRRQARRGARPHRHDPRLDPRRAVHADAGGRAGRAGGARSSCAPSARRSSPASRCRSRSSPRSA